MNTCLRKADVFLAVQEGYEGMKDGAHILVCTQPGLRSAVEQGLLVLGKLSAQTPTSSLERNTCQAECEGVFLAESETSAQPLD